MEDAYEQRKRADEVAQAREALDKADEQLRRVADKYAEDDPADLPSSLL